MKIDRKSVYSDEVYQHISNFAEGNSYQWRIQKHEGNTLYLTKEGITVTFLGTNSLYITDGKIRLLIDPYFSRQEYSLGDLCDIEEERGSSDRYADKRNKEELLRSKPVTENSYDYLNKNKPFQPRTYYPDRNRIESALKKAGINKVDSILMTHAHFDHAFDIAEVSKMLYDTQKHTYPKIAGCESVAYAALGGLMTDSEYKTYQNNDFSSLCKKYNIETVKGNMTIGDFEISFIPGKHITIPFATRRNFIGGKIDKPIRPPARFSEYNEGNLHNILLNHKQFGSILSIGSANYYKNMMDTMQADVLILGVAALSIGNGRFTGDKWLLSEGEGKEIDTFYQEVVEKSNPKQIYFSHWDEFKFPLDKPLEWISYPPNVMKRFRELIEIKGTEREMFYLPVFEGIRILPAKKG